MELKAENEITEVTFDFEGAHLALCHKTQGFSANKKPQPLLVKSDEVEVTAEAKAALEKVKGSQDEIQVTTSLFEFLRKWYNLYWDDADSLARILGFSGDGYEPSEYIEEQTTGIKLLKQKELPELCKASQEDLKALQEFIKSSKIDFEKNSLSEGHSEVKDEKDTSQKPSENKLKSTQGELMSKDLEKLDKAQEDLKALELKVAAFEKSAKDAEEKALELSKKVESFEKAAKERKEKLFTKAVEEYSFITPELKVEFVKTLIKLDSLDGEMSDSVITVLDKAQAAVNAVDSVQGSDKSDDASTEKSSSLAAKLEKKYGAKA